MQPDPARAGEAGAWLEKAAQDLRAGDVDLAASPPLVEDAAFHAQQAVEKALKGFLAAHDRPIRKTHDLVGLGAEPPGFGCGRRRVAAARIATHPRDRLASRHVHPAFALE